MSRRDIPDPIADHNRAKNERAERRRLETLRWQEAQIARKTTARSRFDPENDLAERQWDSWWD